MSVALRNAQSAVSVRRAPLRRAVCALRASLGASRFDVGLVCAGNALMKRLNGAYRQCPEPTDVLSFPFHQVAAGELPRPRCRDEFNLGDIFLGVEYIHQQCRETGEDFEAVLTVSAPRARRAAGRARRRSVTPVLCSCPHAGDGGPRIVPLARLPARHKTRVGAGAGRAGAGEVVRGPCTGGPGGADRRCSRRCTRRKRRSWRS